MAEPLLYQERFERLCCSQCSTVYFVPSDLKSRRLEDGGTFFCPHGHAQVFSEAREIKLEKQLAEEKARHLATLGRLNEANSSLKKKDGEIKRFKARVHNGVCPCCNRTFANLSRHMKSKHPDFKA